MHCVVSLFSMLTIWCEIKHSTIIVGKIQHKFRLHYHEKFFANFLNQIR